MLLELSPAQAFFCWAPMNTLPNSIICTSISLVLGHYIVFTLLTIYAILKSPVRSLEPYYSVMPLSLPSVRLVLTWLLQCENSDIAHAEQFLPIGIGEGCRLKRDVPKDKVLTYEDVELPENRLCDRLRNEQTEYFTAANKTAAIG